MRLYEQKKWWKRALALIAVCIGVFSIWYTSKLVKQLANEEQKKIKLWANATQSMAKAEGNIDFLLDIVTGNETIPIILTDNNDKIISYRNLDSIQARDTSIGAKVGRALNLGRFSKAAEAQSAKQEYRTALRSTQNYQKQLGITPKAATAQKLPGRGVGPKVVGPKAVGPKKVGPKIVGPQKAK